LRASSLIQFRSWATLIILALIWGSSFILIKRGLDHFSSNEVGALRIVITFIFLFPLAIRKLFKLRKRDWVLIAIVGIIGSGIPPFLFAAAQTKIDSYLAGILNSLVPLFTLIIGSLFFRFKSKWYNVLGIFIGLAGAVGLVASTGFHSTSFNFLYAGLIVIATLCYATNVNVVKFYLKDIDAITITSLSFFVIGFPAMVYLFGFTDFLHKMSSQEDAWQGLGYLAILAIFGTGLALIAFNKLIKVATPIFASSVTYLIPVVAIIWGLFDNENFEPIYFVWILIILAGVFLVNFGKK